MLPSYALSISLLLLPLAGQSQTSRSETGLNLTPLFSKVWRVTKAPSTPANGAIYVFLPSGTLLETSCVETYRVATWTIDKKEPRVLRVTEDGQLAFTARIAELNNNTLRLERTLVRSKERLDLVLSSVEKEFVCPDVRK